VLQRQKASETEEANRVLINKNRYPSPTSLRASRFALRALKDAPSGAPSTAPPLAHARSGAMAHHPDTRTARAPSVARAVARAPTAVPARDSVTRLA